MRTTLLMLAATALWAAASCDDESSSPPDQRVADVGADGAVTDAVTLSDSGGADFTPDVGGVDLAPADSAAPADTATPADTAAPDGSSAVDVALDAPAPDQTSPDLAAPDLAVPDLAPPDLAAPDALPAPTGWSVGFGSMMPDVGRGVDSDGKGGALVTGRFMLTVNVGPWIITSKGFNDVFAIRLSGTGQPIWAASFGGTSGEQGNDIAQDGQGGAFVYGVFQDTADLGLGPVTSQGGNDIFVIKLNSAGQVDWVKTYGNAASESATRIASDGQGNAVLVGSFEGTLDLGQGNVTSNGGRDIFVIKLTSSGQTSWVKTFGGSGNESAQGVDADAQSVLLSGAFPGTVDFGKGPVTAKGKLDAYVVKLTGAGQTSWVRTFGGSGITYAAGRAVGRDGQGGALLTGGFDGTVDLGKGNVTSSSGFDLYVTRLDSSGQTDWVRTYSGTGNDFGNGIASDGQGGALVTGTYGGNIDLGSGTVNAKGLYDCFVTRLDSSGQTSWVKTFGANADDDAADLAADGQGGSLVTGYFAFTTDFGYGPVTSKGAADIYVLHIP